MKCSNRNCDHCIGLASYRRGLFVKRRYCSRKCRDTIVAERLEPKRSEKRAISYFEWLFDQSIPNAQLPVSAYAVTWGAQVGGQSF